MQRYAVLVVFAIVIAITGLLAILVSPSARVANFAVLVLLLVAAALAWAIRFPGGLSDSPRRLPTLTDDEQQESDAEPDMAGYRLAGNWRGTLRLWPDHRGQTVRLYPVRLRMEDDPPRARVLNPGAGRAPRRVVAVEILEHDAEAEQLDLALTIQDRGRQERHVAQLSWRSGVLTTESEGEPVSLTLSPAGAPIHHACPA